MQTIDRRSAIRDIMCVTIAAGIGLALIPNVVEATPLAMDKALVDKTDDLIKKAQVVVVNPRRRRRRRRVCWWSRGRRVCSWRW